jgi:H+/Cl- antiporter ClcA
MKKSTFYFNWVSFILGLFFGIFGVLFSLLARNDRRDKIYSSVLGCAIGMVITFLLLRSNPGLLSSLSNSG